MEKKIARIACAMMLVSALGLFPLLPANADGGTADYTVPATDQQVNGKQLVAPERDSHSPIPADVRNIIAQMEQKDYRQQIVSSEYVDHNTGIRIYAGGDITVLRRELAHFTPSIPINIIQSPYTLRQLQNGIDQLLERTQDFNNSFVEAHPKTDGTGIQIVLDDKLATENTDIYSITSIPLEISYGLKPTQAS